MGSSGGGVAAGPRAGRRAPGGAATRGPDSRGRLGAAQLLDRAGTAVTPDVARSARGRVCTDAARALGPLAAVLLCLVGCSKNPVAVHETVPVDSLILSPASATMLIGGSQSFSVAAYDTAGALIAAPAIV